MKLRKNYNNITKRLQFRNIVVMLLNVIYNMYKILRSA